MIANYRYNYRASEACTTTLNFLEKIPVYVIIICKIGWSTQLVMTIFHLLLSINVVIEVFSLSIVALCNSAINVVYDEIIFHVELNISIARVINDKTTFQVIFLVSAVDLVNDEIIFNLVLGISVVSVVSYHHF